MCRCSHENGLAISFNYSLLPRTAPVSGQFAVIRLALPTPGKGGLSESTWKTGPPSCAALGSVDTFDEAGVVVLLVINENPVTELILAFTMIYLRHSSLA